MRYMHSYKSIYIIAQLCVLATDLTHTKQKLLWWEKENTHTLTGNNVTTCQNTKITDKWIFLATAWSQKML